MTPAAARGLGSSETSSRCFTSMLTVRRALSMPPACICSATPASRLQAWASLALERLNASLRRSSSPPPRGPSARLLRATVCRGDSPGPARPSVRSLPHETRWRRWGLIVPIGVLGLVLLAPIAALLATTWVLGWRLQVVETSSMRPLYPSGTLVAVEPIDAAPVDVRMAIVFRGSARPDRLVAHRPVDRLPGQRTMWRANCDANLAVDP